MKRALGPYTNGAIRLRPLAEDDLRATLGWRNREGARQQFKNSDVLTWEQHYGWFARYFDKPDDLVFIVESAESQERIGQVAIYAIDDVAHLAEVGRFIVAPEYQGRGFMRQAITALMRVASQELGLAAVYLEVIETNERARRLYEALGFVQTNAANGLIRMERSVDGGI